MPDELEEARLRGGDISCRHNRQQQLVESRAKQFGQALDYRVLIALHDELIDQGIADRTFSPVNGPLDLAAAL